jgi:hypothetical protein
MTKAEILQALVSLSPEERREIRAKLNELDDEAIDAAMSRTALSDKLVTLYVSFEDDTPEEWEEAFRHALQLQPGGDILQVSRPFIAGAFGSRDDRRLKIDSTGSADRLNDVVARNVGLVIAAIGLAFTTMQTFKSDRPVIIVIEGSDDSTEMQLGAGKPIDQEKIRDSLKVTGQPTHIRVRPHAHSGTGSHAKHGR